MAPTATDSSNANDDPISKTGVAVGKPPRPPQFTSKEQERKWLKSRLAQAFRIFGKYGYDEGVAGHITVRVSPNNTRARWDVSRLGLTSTLTTFEGPHQDRLLQGKHFSLIQPEDLILVNHHGVVQAAESGPNTLLNKAAFMIHSAIHTARPDVHCAAHSHSVYGRAFSTLGKELDMITQDSCAFYEDHSVYSQYGGVVLDEEEGDHIVKALGNKKAVILQNHGILVATNSIEATVHFFIALEKSCQVQLLADSAAAGRGGKTVKIADADAKITYNVVGGLPGGWFSGLPHFQALEAQEGISFDFGSQ